MKKYIIFFFLLVFSAFRMSADENSNAPINLQHQNQHDHLEYYPPADMPEAFFNLDEMEVIIEADGFADYYVVNIISQVTMQCVIYTQISSYGDSVDVSSLPDGYYRLVITSSNSNVFEGYFMIKNNSRLPLSRIR